MFRNSVKHPHPRAATNKSLYLSVLLQRIHRTGSKHPQRVIGQNDEHVYSFAVLCGPGNREGTVCASTWNLGHRIKQRARILLRVTVQINPQPCNCNLKQLSWFHRNNNANTMRQSGKCAFQAAFQISLWNKALAALVHKYLKMTKNTP